MCPPLSAIPGSLPIPQRLCPIQVVRNAFSEEGHRACTEAPRRSAILVVDPAFDCCSPQ
jgi:hypothetical protein